MIQNILNKFYKAAQYGIVVISSWYSTRIFRMLLWLNKVNMGRNIQTMKAIPSLVINRNAKRVAIGDNAVFNNYGDHSYYCKCKLMVRSQASLEIGNNVGMNGVLIFCSDNITIGDNVKMGGVQKYLTQTFIH